MKIAVVLLIGTLANAAFTILDPAGIAATEYKVEIPTQTPLDLSYAVIHHTAGYDMSASEIEAIHVKERGFDEIGYHFVIRSNGDIERGRGLDTYGAHDNGTNNASHKSRNHHVGIVLTGFDNFTAEQIDSLKSLLRSLKTRYIDSHHERCVGKGLDLDAIATELGVERYDINTKSF